MNRRDAIKNTVLVGGTSALGISLLSILQSCQSEPRSSWNPVFLNNDHTKLVSALVDTVLPKTDTPGGLDVKVDLFIDQVLGKIYNEEGQKAMVAQMTAFNEKCKAKFGKAFHEMDASQKQSLLQEEEKNSPKFNSGVWGTAVGKQEPVGFYRSIKSMMLWGYFSSEEIGKNVLNYDPIPGEYLGCVPLSEVGRNYSL